MQFNPKIGFVLGIMVTVETAISGGLLNLTNAIPAAYIPTVVAWSSLLAFAGSAILTGLHAYSNGQTGPMVPDAPLDTTVKATDKAIADLGSLKSQALAGTLAQPQKAPAIALLILGTALLGLLLHGAAYAQAVAQNPRTPTARPFTPTPLTGDPIKDINNAVAQKKTEAVANANQSVEDVVAAIQKLALPDFQYALAMSIATKNVVSTPCWQAWVDLVTAQQSPLMGPGAPVLDANGKPTVDANGKPVLGPPQALVEPDPHLITSVEQISELLANLRPDSAISTSCAALAAAAGKDAATLIQGILNGGALGLFRLPIPVGPIP
jgi:hypothetical protein